MRVTTNSIIRNYNNSLSTSLNNRTSAANTALTLRSYNSVAEDPSSAAKATRLERKYSKNEDNLDTIDDAQSRLDGQESALMAVSKVLTTISENYNVSAMSDTNADQRGIYADAIRSYMNTMVSDLNATYADTYLLAGADGDNPPFSLSDDGTLTYRGVDVNSSEGTDAYDTLTDYANEHVYVDIGLGLSLDSDGTVDSSSAFDVSLSGIKVLGYGKDSDGDNQNVITLAGQLADMLEADTFDSDAYGELMDKFKNLSTSVSNKVTQIGIKSEFLSTTEERLENLNISLQEQLENVENVDMEAAYTNYSQCNDAYTAALKIGTTILSASFIDFMS